MAAADAAAAPVDAVGREGGLRGRAFGLDVRATYDIPALGAVGNEPSPRTTVCRHGSVVELRRAWADSNWEHAVELRHRDGRLFMSICSHAEQGFRIWAPRYGRHLVSADGRDVCSTLPGRSPLAWQRLFFAQALPLAAALQGIEVLHASAVALEDRVIAFAAASGTGKSSLAAHLVAAGATFVTDDVLAVERRDGAVRAHPGPARTSVSSHEARGMTRSGRRRLGRRVGSADKALFEPAVVPADLPLAILYRVMREDGFALPRLEEQVPPQPRTILASSFLSYLRTPARLLTQLGVCEGITSSVRVFDFRVPPSVSAREAAALVLAHTEGVLTG